MVMYKGDTGYMTASEKQVMEDYLKRGGGLISIHDTLWGDDPQYYSSIAADLGLVGYLRNDRDTLPEKVEQAMRPSVWVVLARSQADLGQIAQAAGRWARLDAAAGDPLWTDDYSNVLRALSTQ